MDSIEVSDVVDTYLRVVDEEAPGLVEGLYLVGSVALGEFRPHTSDVDFVAVTAEPVAQAAVSALDRAHRRLRRHRRRPTFDGHYVTWTDLRADPALAPPRPTSHEGRLATAPSTPDPVAWHTLAQCGVPCRGPAVADLEVWTDADVLRRWVLRNLDDYWGRLRRRGGRPLSPHGLMSLSDYAVEWCVPGLSRIHHTVVTGEIIGKEGGVRHALRTFPSRWERILEESLRIRAPPSNGAATSTRNGPRPGGDGASREIRSGGRLAPTGRRTTIGRSDTMDDFERQTAGGKVLWHFTMSLDGFVAAPGHGMDWMAGTTHRAGLTDEYIGTTGAVLGGRDAWDHFPNADGLYGGAWTGPVFVLTHHPEDAVPAERVTFLSCGLAEAVRIGLEAAGGKNLEVLSASIGGQLLQLGLIDEIDLHIAPVLLGDGIRLFDNPGGGPVRLNRVGDGEPTDAVNVRYRPA